MSFARLQTRTRLSSAFTLVELMIVIAIVGILASLVTVGVMKALEKAKDVSARLEISQIEAAIAAAKQKLNLNGLPTYLVIFEDLQSFYAVANTPTNADYIGASAAYTMLSKIYESNDFKNWYKIPPTSPPYKKDWNGNQNINEPNNGRIELVGVEALLFLLGGEVETTIANGTKTIPKFNGFNLKDPKKPKGPFYEPSGNVWANSNNYFSIYDANQTPYAYFDSGDYKYCFTSTHPLYAKTNTLGVKPYVLKFVPPAPYTLATLGGQNSLFSWVNPRSFQLISAGKDQTFGKNFYITGYPSSLTSPPMVNPTTPFSSTAGVYSSNHLNGEPFTYIAGEGCWRLTVPTGNDTTLTTGYDDISNFASSFLGKKDE